MRPTNIEVDERIEEWVRHVVTSREFLLRIDLSGRAPEAKLSVRYLAEQLNLAEATLHKRGAQFEPVLKALRAEGIIVEGHPTMACDYRRKLLMWYETMTLEEKLSIPVAGNTIKQRGYLDGVIELSNLRVARTKYELVRDTYDDILTDLRKFGVLDAEYRTVKERLEEKAPQIKTKSLKEKFEELRSRRIYGLDDIASTTEEPFYNLLHVFSVSSMKSSSQSGQDNFINGYKAMREYLVMSGFSGSEDIREMLTPFSLPRLRSYMQERIVDGVWSTSHSSTMLSSLRKVMARVQQINEFGLNSYVAASGFDVERETDRYKPYPVEIRKNISEAIFREIEETNQLGTQYVPIGMGEDPVDSAGRLTRGSATLENARWIFENKLNCEPIGYKTGDKNNVYHQAFLRIANGSEHSLSQIYKDWGCLYELNARVLAPYIARLAQVTGLNADSLIGLETDDFIESHDLTGRPCLLYWKERSTGEKIYHLDLFHAEISWLTGSQARDVQKVFNDVISLTSKIREMAPEGIRNKLFIYKSSSPRSFGVMKSVESSKDGAINRILSEFSEDHGLLDEKGEKLCLSASRFRPSFISELVERGVSIREIQVLLGHANISTTIAYLDKMDFNFIARKKLNEALHEIQQSTLQEPAQVTLIEVVQVHSEKMLINTGLAGCRDVFDPPEFIKGMAGYDPKKPCALLNKCLSCSNVIVTVSHLPELFAMRRDYHRMIEATRVLDTPYGHVVLENLDALGSILNPDTSDFSADELSYAERLSDNVVSNLLVEGVQL